VTYIIRDVKLVNLTRFLMIKWFRLL